MAYSTYSLNDVSVVVSNHDFGNRTITGEGLGSITTEMTTDRTTHETAADGAVMVSKVNGRNGTIAIVLQQTSAAHQWLTKLYNYLEAATAEKWAATSITITTLATGETESCTGVSFTKLPSNPRQAQGQNLTWTLMAADIQRTF